MGLVAQIVVLPLIEARTSRGSPITIGNNLDRYVVDEFIPGEREGSFAPYSLRDRYIVTPFHITDSEWTEEFSFTVDADELEKLIDYEI